MIDDDFQDDALRNIAARDETYADQYDVLSAWEAIRADMRSRGPFTRMLLELRATARQAMQDIVYIDPTDARRIASLQGEVRRYTHMMTILSEYRSQAATADANTEGDDLSEEDSAFIASFEQP